MKNLLAIFLVVLGLVAVQVAATKQQQDPIKKEVEECQYQEDPTDDEVKTILKTGPPSTLEGKCFLGCLYEKLELLVNGAFSSTTSDKWIATVFANDKAKQQQAKADMGGCKPELAGLPKDKCQTGPAVQKCLVRVLTMHLKREQSG